MPKLTSAFISDCFSSVLSVPVSQATAYCRSQTLPLSVRMDYSAEKDKLVVVVGSTGSGKSRLAVDLATRFPAEIINSDKLQFYNRLPITTNQMSADDRRGIPHHLLGHLDPEDGEVTPEEFRSAATLAISGIVSRGKLPILAGGSNSFVHALLTERFDPATYPFSLSGSICSELRYDCCFLWVDVSLPVLFDYLSKRVDEMLDAGMLEELADFYDPNKESNPQVGLWKSIGVPEFDQYFRKYPPAKNETAQFQKTGWDQERKRAFERAVRETKENTYKLVKNQLEKIVQLRSAGWDIRRIDATASLRKKLAAKRGEEWNEAWENEVLEPSVKILKQFLE